ncbi:nucleotidyltransferase [Prosthecobacter sp.]|uniref:nucleotidyltransferase n=1 Tax=Prosthecobacter sp. TaxID=1965333 RepID=UPI0037833B7C
MDGEDDEPQEGELISRAPTEDDLVAMCRQLNDSGARYMIVGGFAIMYAGHSRTTGDVDLLFDTDLVNEAKVYRCLESLPDKAVLHLQSGDVEKYTVVRVADEIIIDLMKSASGIDYEEASKEVVIRTVQGVPIPFASPRLLWRMKKNTHREKDRMDLVFLRQQYPEVTD